MSKEEKETIEWMLAWGFDEESILWLLQQEEHEGGR
jgi:hypothetical protein